jgi:hypothetical protein
MTSPVKRLVALLRPGRTTHPDVPVRAGSTRKLLKNPAFTLVEDLSFGRTAAGRGVEPEPLTVAVADGVEANDVVNVSMTNWPDSTQRSNLQTSRPWESHRRPGGQR